MSEVLIAHPFDLDCIAENIRKDKIINGVVGNLVPGGLGNVMYITDKDVSYYDGTGSYCVAIGYNDNYVVGLFHPAGNSVASYILKIPRTGNLECIGCSCSIGGSPISYYLDNGIIYINVAFYHKEYNIDTGVLSEQLSGNVTTGINIGGNNPITLNGITYTGYANVISGGYSLITFGISS